MKKITSLLLLAATFSCSNKEEVIVTVSNPTTTDRNQEMVEVPLDQNTKLKKISQNPFIITSPSGDQIPYQITYDHKIIFPASVEGNAENTYIICPGKPQTVETIACGNFYPQRLDDIAWENDRIAFRTYGPALQATGERGYGYDVWTKSVTQPVVAMRYAMELDQEARARMKELRSTNPAIADSIGRAISYHIDHGNGMDFYAVGPTLGAGTSALMAGDSIIYPYCFKEYEILDNGPLRFTTKLIYHPLTIGTDTAVIETRLISLDAGNQLNKTRITYENLTQAAPIVTGLVMHAPSDEYQADAAAGYIAYADVKVPENGQIYVAAIIPQTQKLQDAKAVYFTEEEKGRHGGASGQVITISPYTPGEIYTYYWGAGWNKYGFETPSDWYNYIKEETDNINNPLQVSLR